MILFIPRIHSRYFSIFLLPCRPNHQLSHISFTVRESVARVHSLYESIANQPARCKNPLCDKKKLLLSTCVHTSSSIRTSQVEKNNHTCNYMHYSYRSALTYNILAYIRIAMFACQRLAHILPPCTLATLTYHAVTTHPG